MIYQETGSRTVARTPGLRALEAIAQWLRMIVQPCHENGFAAGHHTKRLVEIKQLVRKAQGQIAGGGCLDGDRLAINVRRIYFVGVDRIGRPFQPVKTGMSNIVLLPDHTLGQYSFRGAMRGITSASRPCMLCGRPGKTVRRWK